MGTLIRVEGFEQIPPIFKRMEAELKKEVRTGLRDIAKLVAAEAKEIAVREDIQQSGDFIRSIKPSVRGASANVRIAAVHRGFNYPVRFEYGDYKRPVLKPAVEAKTPAIIARGLRIIDEVGNAGGFH